MMLVRRDGVPVPGEPNPTATLPRALRRSQFRLTGWYCRVRQEFIDRFAADEAGVVAEGYSALQW